MSDALATHCANIEVDAITVFSHDAFLNCCALLKDSRFDLRMLGAAREVKTYDPRHAFIISAR